MHNRPVLLPARQMPNIEVPTVGKGLWKLSQSSPENFTMIVIYRGLHCPICKRQLQEIVARKTELDQRGVNVIAISSDSEARASESHSAWELGGLELGYGLPLEQALELGLFVSEGRPDTAEPERFVEPGLFLVRSDGTLYCSSIQSMPFARPKLDDVLGAIDFVLAKNYPPRGTVDTL